MSPVALNTMNNFSKTVYLCLSRTRNPRGIQVSKMSLYRLFRSAGCRLYSTEAWMKSPTCNLAPAVTPQLTQVQSFSTTEPNRDNKNKMIKKLRSWIPGVKSEDLNINAVRLYLSCTSAVNYNKIHEHVDLPSSFATWYALVTLHIWMLMTRLVNEEDGKKRRDLLIVNFHTDVEQKVKDIGDKLEIRVLPEEVTTLLTQLPAALLAYDEGLLLSDRHLAGAVWRMLFQQSPDVNPSDLELMVQYIRKNVKLIHNLKQEHIIEQGLLPFLPLQGNSVTPDAYNMLERVGRNKP